MDRISAIIRVTPYDVVCYDNDIPGWRAWGAWGAHGARKKWPSRLTVSLVGNRNVRGSSLRINVTVRKSPVGWTRRAEPRRDRRNTCLPDDAAPRGVPLPPLSAARGRAWGRMWPRIPLLRVRGGGRERGTRHFSSQNSTPSATSRRRAPHLSFFPYFS